MVEGASIQVLIPITAENVVTSVQEDNTVAIAPVRVRRVISSVTARALIRTSMTTTVENVEMSVLQTQAVPQEFVFLTRDNLNILPIII